MTCAINGDSLLDIEVNQIEIGENYRKTYDEQGLKELGANIKANGLVQRIIVKKNPDTRGLPFLLVVGQRRLLACQKAKLPSIPAIVRDIGAEKVLITQLIENVQREDVPLIEEATAILILNEDHGMEVKQIAKHLGKSETHIMSILKVANACAELHDALAAGTISRTVSVHIASMPNLEHQAQAVAGLKRQRTALVTIKEADKYLKNKFGVNATRKAPSNAEKKAKNLGFAANWKTHLLSFTHKEFDKWVNIVNKRTDNNIWSEAVESVMLDRAGK
jgi:ParB/RepB/Spo0J family partition protein